MATLTPLRDTYRAATLAQAIGAVTQAMDEMFAEDFALVSIEAERADGEVVIHVEYQKEG